MRKIIIFCILLLIILGCKKDDITSPSEVSNLIATYNGTNLILTWIDPLDNDLSRIEITYEDISFEINNGIQLKEIYNLEIGKNYTFTVKTIDKSENKSKGIQIQYKIDYRLQFTGKYRFSSNDYSIYRGNTTYSDTSKFIGSVSIVENTDSIIRIVYDSSKAYTICNSVHIYGDYIEPNIDIKGVINYRNVLNNCYLMTYCRGGYSNLSDINIEIGIYGNNHSEGQIIKGIKIK